MKEIDRKVFVSLCRDNFYENHYIVLCDGNYQSDFYANNDSEAIDRFRKGDYK